MSSLVVESTWEVGIFQSWSLTCILLIPILFLALGVFFGIGQQLIREEKKCEDCETESPSACWHCFDFRIDWNSKPSVDQLLQQAPQSVREVQQRTIGPVSQITEQDIKEAYPGELGEKVVLFLRLATVLVSSGMCSTDNQAVLQQVAAALQMPSISFLSVGLSEITAQFQLGPVINISCAADYKLSLLSDTQQLTDRIIEGQASVESTLRVLDQLEDSHAVPYGSTIRFLAMYLASILAPITVYRGGYPNLLMAAILSPALIAEIMLLNRFGGVLWETPLVSFTTGLLSPILWQAYRHWEPTLEPCVAGYTIGVLLLWLPGSSIVFGAHEISRGGYINGSARLIKGIVQAGMIALFYTLGWQYWGRNWASEETLLGIPTNLYGTSGPKASLPPSITCPSGWDYQLPWYYSSVLWMLPLNACSLVIFNIHLRQGLGVFCVAQTVYTIQGVLGQCYEQEQICALPTYVQTLLVAFMGGFLAQANHLLTGFSQFGTVVCIILILAPGAGAVRAILGAFHRAEGDKEATDSTLWESVVFVGVAYSVGFYLAFDVWEPLQEPLFWLRDRICCCCTRPADTTKPNLRRGEEPADEPQEDDPQGDNRPRMGPTRQSTRRLNRRASDFPRPGTF